MDRPRRNRRPLLVVVGLAIVLIAGTVLAAPALIPAVAREIGVVPVTRAVGRIAADPSLAPALRDSLRGAFDVEAASPGDALQMLLDGRVDAGVYMEQLESKWTESVRVASIPEIMAVHTLGGEAVPLDKARDMQPAIRLVEVQGVRPDYDSVMSGRYPLQQPVFVTTRRSTPIGLRLSNLLGYTAHSASAIAALSSPPVIDGLAGVEKTVSLTAVGDIMLARGVAAYIRKHGVEYPSSLVADITSSSDITFANLESPIGTKGNPLPGKMIWFRADPSSVECLTRAGVDVVTLANNHTLDYDSENLLETIEILDASGIAHTGAGRDITEARRPAVIERDGIRVAFLGYNEFANPSLYWSTKYPRTLLATDSLPGTPPVDPQMISEDIAAAKKIADVVVVSFHWGQEYVNYPQAYFGRDLKQIARETIDSGADLVLGYHPHAIQGFEVYKGKTICYSLGNFIMDQKRPVTCESMIVRFDVARTGVKSMEIIPAFIEDGRPRPLYGEEAEKAMAKIREISDGLAGP